MMKKFLILLAVLGFHKGQITANTKKRCDCSELEKSNCKSSPYWCWWKNGTCISHNQDCENINDSINCQYQWTHLYKSCDWQSQQYNQGFCYTIDATKQITLKDCIKANGFWNNSTCSYNFTKCEDYSLDACPGIYSAPPNGCQIKNNLCTPIPYLQCTSLDDCIHIYTSQEQTHYCIQIEGKCYKVKESDSCPSFNGVKAACQSYYPECFYEEPNCRAQLCSDVTDNKECGLMGEFGVFVTFCEWKDSKCQNATDLNRYESSCYDISHANYLWKNNTCQKCSKLVDRIPIHSYSLFKDILNSTNSGNTTSNPTTNSATNSTTNSTANSTSNSTTNSNNQTVSGSQGVSYGEIFIELNFLVSIVILLV